MVDAISLTRRAILRSVPPILLGLSAGSARASWFDRPYLAFPTTLVSDLTRSAYVHGQVPGLSDVTEDGHRGVRVSPPTKSEFRLATAGTFSVPIDMRDPGDSIAIDLKPIANVAQGANNLDRLVLEIFSDDDVATLNALTTIRYATSADFGLRSTSADAQTAGRMQRYSVALGQFTEKLGTGADLSQVRGVRVSLRSADASATPVIEGLQIWYVPNPYPKAAVIFGFDDLHDDGFSFDAMRDRGFPGALYGGAWAANVGLPGRLNAQQIEQRRFLGWQCCGQAYDSEQTISPEAMDLMKQFGRNSGWDDDMLDFSYYSGFSHKNMTAFESMTAAGARTIRTYFVGNPTDPPFLHGETLPPGDRLAIRALSGTNEHTLAHLEQARNNRGLAIIVRHNELSANSPDCANARARFEEELDWCATNADTVQVTTPKALLYG